MGIGHALASVSVYAKPESHLITRTAHGAAVTICGVILAMSLFIHETKYFWELHRETKMSVDMERRHDLPVFVDMTFPAVPCAVLSVDVLDVTGQSESDASIAKGMDLRKIRLDANGKRIGRTDYVTPQSQQVVEDASGQSMMNVNVPMAMKHLTEMEEEADNNEGCRLTGTMLVHRVAGRLHMSVHQSVVFQMMPQLLAGHRIPRILNMSHTIHHLAFGPHFPGQLDPLDGYDRHLADHPQTFKYFLKVVPTLYHGRLGGVTETHQYSVTEYSSPIPTDGTKVPAVDFIYDMSPIVVTLNEQQPSILHYLVRMSAVIGGVFAITRLVDRNVHWVMVKMKWYHGA